MAWLNATPQPPEGSRSADPKYKRERVSRIAQLKKDGAPIRMPPNPLPSVISRLIEIGLTEAAGMGVAPISWLTLDAWQRITGVILPPWEARLIRALSVEYLAESRRAESENCPAPWRSGVSQEERDAELVRLMSVLG